MLLRTIYEEMQGAAGSNFKPSWKAIALKFNEGKAEENRKTEEGLRKRLPKLKPAKCLPETSEEVEGAKMSS